MSALNMDGSIGIYELKNRLSAVLEEVMDGREVTVTKHGRSIARIAPVAAPSRQDRVAAIAAIHGLADQVRRMPDELSVRALIDAGRTR